MSTSDGSAVASLSLQEKPGRHDEVCREPDSRNVAQTFQVHGRIARQSGNDGGGLTGPATK